MCYVSFIIDQTLINVNLSFVSVENVSVIVNDECNSFTRIIWTLRGDGVMLSEVNFTITITDSMGSLYRIVNIRANDCMNSTLTCGEHLTEFDYTSIDGLAVNEVYNVSIRTTINEPTMHEVLTPVVSIIENTTIEGELHCSSMCIILKLSVISNFVDISNDICDTYVYT